MALITQSSVFKFPTIMTLDEFIFILVIVSCIWCNINSIDVVLGDYNNNHLNINWYDIISILSVPLRHQFICEGRYISDAFHDKDFDPSVDNNYIIDDYIQKKTWR